MKFIWVFAALFAFVTADSNNPSNAVRDFTVDYNWECGKVLNSTLDLNSCAYLLNWLGTASKTGWWTIGTANVMNWSSGFCQVTIKSGPLSHFVLNMNGEEFAQVTQWAHKERCKLGGQRAMVAAKNSSWTAYIVETGWDHESGVF
ncbi:hypothetical protein ACHAPO_002217 [Fusarium lateritium]